ncbi:MAG: ribokinase [Erysipelotrichaceae bacterium]|nr:ribokinase [Erysipelotrichaceae bacterium]
MKILVMGSTNLDYNYRLDHIVRPKETIAAKEFEIHAGGKGLNQSIALAKTGEHVYLAAAIGNNAQMLVATLKKYNVDTRYLRELDMPNGHAIIEVDEHGENAIIIVGGSNRCFTEEYIESVFADFKEGDFLVLQNEINNLKYIIDRAYEKKMVILMNPSPCDESLRELPLHKLSYIFINEVEGEFLTGESQPKAILDKLQEIYPDTNVILTLGANGAFYQSKGVREFAPSRKINAIDTVGAGDTFSGYFTYGLSKGLSPKQCLEIATKAASITCTRYGAAASIPSLEEVNALD